MGVNTSFGPIFRQGLTKGARNTYSPSPIIIDLPNRWFNINPIGRIDGYIFDRIGGTDVPIQRKIFLIRDIDALRMRMRFSDPVTGYYSFDALEMGYTYSVIAQDLHQNRNATIKDKITPTPIQ